MKLRLHVLLPILFVLSLLYDLALWGGTQALPGVGPSIAQSARREAPLAWTYIVLGEPLTNAMPSVRAWSVGELTRAWGDAFARIEEDPAIAMDALSGESLNGTHRRMRVAYWAPPVLLVLALIAWLRRPRQVRMMGRG